MPRTPVLASQHQPAVVVTSCQRVEIYHLTDCECAAPVKLQGPGAMHHLTAVAAGVESAVFGEEQILGQVRSAWASAPPELTTHGEVAVAAARELRSAHHFETDSGHLLDQALAIAGQEPGGTAIVAGAGSMGRLIAERAIALGFGRVVIASRRPMAHPPRGVEWTPLASLAECGPADVLITCLGSGAQLLDAARLPAIRGPIVDLGTPRNTPAEMQARIVTIAEIIENETDEARQARAQLDSELREIVARRLRERAETGESPVGRMRMNVERLRAEEAARIQRLHPELDVATVDLITRGVVNRIFHAPSSRLRERDSEFSERVADLFAVEATE